MCSWQPLETHGNSNVEAVPNSSNVAVTDFTLSLILTLFGYITLLILATLPDNIFL